MVKEVETQKELEKGLTIKQKRLVNTVIKEKINSTREKVKAHALKFRQELRKSILTAIVAAFGFLIALTWRDVIKTYISVFETYSPLQGELTSAVIVTIISVLGILIVTKVFSSEK